MNDPLRAAMRRLGLAIALGYAVLGSAIATTLADDRHTQSWHEMSPQERGEAYRNYQRFQKMPPEQRREVERNYDRWQRMPPQEKERMRSNYRQYREMPRKERRELDRREDRRKRRD